MRGAKWRTVVILLTSLVAISPLLTSQEARRSEREAMKKVEGEWVGAFVLGKDTVYLRVGFETKQGTRQMTVLSMIPGNAASATDLRLEPPRVHFSLPGGSHPIVFDGGIQGRTISGAVRRAEERGRFQFVRLGQVDSAILDEYAGAYKIEPNRFVFVRRGDRLKMDPPSPVEKSWLYYVEESGRTGILFPSSETTFFSGPTYLVPVPVELEVTFLRNGQGRVSGLLWRERGVASRRVSRSRSYREEEIRFPNASVTLAGRLLVPSKRGRHPAVALISGAGPANRNQEYEIVGDIFARHGIAALVYDKRGTGGSTGDWHEASPGDLSDDALAGVELLRHRADIDPNQVGLWGISEGGSVAALAASRVQTVAFLVAVSAGAVPRSEAEATFVEQSLRLRGASAAEISEAVALAKLEGEFATTGHGWGELEAAVTQAREKNWFPYTWTGIFGAFSKDHWSWRWYRQSASDDPLPPLRRLACPVLAIWGDRDPYFAQRNKTRVERALEEGGNRDYTIKVFPNAGHTLGLEEVGGDVRFKTSVPGYFETMTEWILKRVKKPTHGQAEPRGHAASSDHGVEKRLKPPGDRKREIFRANLSFLR